MGAPAAAGTTAGSAGRPQLRARPGRPRPPSASGTTLPGVCLVMSAATGDRARQGASGTSTRLARHAVTSPSTPALTSALPDTGPGQKRARPMTMQTRGSGAQASFSASWRRQPVCWSRTPGAWRARA